MHEALSSSAWKKIMFVMFITGSILLTVSYYDYSKLFKYQMMIRSRLGWPNKVLSSQSKHSEDTTKAKDPEEKENSLDENEPYLVSSSKCNIINLDPFSHDAKKYFRPMKYRDCRKHDLLTFVKTEDKIATVYIDTEVIPQYTESSISCCYSDIWRLVKKKSPDRYIYIGACKKFQNNVTITREAIAIKCNDTRSKKIIYVNVHTSVAVTEDVEKKLNIFENSTNKPLSILFIGIDSISRLNFIRAMPKTYKHVEDNGWVPLKGYNKIDDNTFPNLMAILTGFNSTVAFEKCDPTKIGSLDRCPMLWYTFRDLGYITAYAEDESIISTFNYIKKGFVNPPADYYYRPYVIATETLKKVIVSDTAYCTGPMTSGERIMEIAKDFGKTFKNQTHFGFFWMNSFSHNYVSTPSMMDDKVKSFLELLKTSGVTNSSLIIFLSDHGIRFGNMRMTQTGWLEERLPFIYFSFPPWFKRRFSTEFFNFKNNVNKLTTPYDVHMTLQHVLRMSEFNYTIKPSDACPKCMSLFENVPKERSCEDAAIKDHWCTCVTYTETILPKPAREKVSGFFIDSLNNIVADRVDYGGDKCAEFTADELTTRLSQKFSYKNTSYILVLLKTIPKAIFETTIRYEGDIMESDFKIGDISRLDWYSMHSGCVQDSDLKKYCYCM